MAEDPSPAADAREQLQLALERTYLACERTLQAWIRTSASLITFGFALFKVFDYLNALDPGRVRNRILTARGFGIVMIFAGLAGLILATVQYRQAVERLKPQYAKSPLPVALLIAALIVLLGLLALAEAVLRHV